MSSPGSFLVASSFSAHWYHDWTEEYDAAEFATALAATGTIFGWIFFVSMFTKSRWGNVAAGWLFLALIVISVAYIAWRTTYDEMGFHLAAGFYLALFGTSFSAAPVWLRMLEHFEEPKVETPPSFSGELV